MLGSAVVYAGALLAVIGLAGMVRPIRRLGLPTRRRALVLAATGALAAITGLLLPAPESSAASPVHRLDDIMPVWQFDEVHALEIAAPPSRVFDAIRRVRADEIRLFRTLTWIRRGGQPLPEGILNAGNREALIDVAIRGGFVMLADEPPREIVIGAAVVAPPGTRGPLTPEAFERPLPPGYALAAMNFVVTPLADGGSRVTTETRVYANSDSARRRFAAYWRVIYPGSALIRRMWLRAIERRATSGTGAMTGDP
jgi:hypothetical protein